MSPAASNSAVLPAASQGSRSLRWSRSQTAPLVTASRVYRAPVQAVWELLADPRNHPRWIPQTRVEMAAEPAAGRAFVAYSGPGARRGLPGLPDRMTITDFTPPTAGSPGHGVYVKTGPLLLGEATITVEVTAEGARAVWTERVHLAGPLPKSLTGAVVGPFLHAMLVIALRRAAGELERPGSRGKGFGNR